MLVPDEEGGFFCCPRRLWSLAWWHNGNTLRTCHWGQSQVKSVKRKTFLKTASPLEGSDPWWQKGDSRDLRSAELWKCLLHNHCLNFPVPVSLGNEISLFCSSRWKEPGCNNQMWGTRLRQMCSLWPSPLLQLSAATLYLLLGTYHRGLTHRAGTLNNGREGGRRGEEVFSQQGISLQGRSLLESVNAKHGSPTCAFMSAEQRRSH